MIALHQGTLTPRALHARGAAPLAPPPAAPRSPQARRLIKRIDTLGPWFHNLRLPVGDGAEVVETALNHPLGDFPAAFWSVFRSAIPKSLAGKSVLDIGYNAGCYSFEMKRRGAARALLAACAVVLFASGVFLGFITGQGLVAALFDFAPAIAAGAALIIGPATQPEVERARRCQANQANHARGA